MRPAKVIAVEFPLIDKTAGSAIVAAMAVAVIEDAFAKVETYRGNPHCGRLLSSWRSPATTSWHIDAVQQGPSIQSTPAG